MIAKVLRTLVPNSLSAVLSAVAILLMVRVLPPAEWGLAAMILGLGQLGGSVASFGTQSERIRRYGQLAPVELRRLASEDSAARLGLASVLVLAALLTAFWRPDIASIVLVAAGTFCSLGVSNHLAASGRYLSAACLILVEKALVLVVVLLAIAYVEVDVLTLSIAVGASALIVSTAVLTKLRPDVSRTGLIKISSQMKHYWAGSFAVGIASVAPSLLLLDVSLVRTFAGAEEAGFFAVASRITAPFSILASAIAIVVLSEGSRGRLPGSQGISRRSIVALGMAITVVGGCIALADMWVPLLFGEGYERSVWPVRAYLVNVIFLLCTRTCVALLHARKDDRFVAISIAVQVLLALIGISIGAAYGGEVLASVALALTNAGLSVVLLGRVRGGLFRQKH